MKHKLWTLAFVLVLLRTRLDFLYGGTQGNKTFETFRASSISTQINHATPQSPMCRSLKRFSHDLMEELNLRHQQHGPVRKMTHSSS